MVIFFSLILLTSSKSVGTPGLSTAISMRLNNSSLKSPSTISPLNSGESLSFSS